MAVLVLTCVPVADRIDRIAVAPPTRTRRGIASELVLTAVEDEVAETCVASFDYLHTSARSTCRPRLGSAVRRSDGQGVPGAPGCAGLLIRGGGAGGCQ